MRTMGNAHCGVWGMHSMVLGDCTPWGDLEFWGMHTTEVNAVGLGVHTVWGEGLPVPEALRACPKSSMWCCCRAALSQGAGEDPDPRSNQKKTG